MSSTASAHSILCIMNTSPFDNLTTIESLHAMMTLASHDLSVQLCLSLRGQLLLHSKTPLEHKTSTSLAALINSLHLYDLTPIWLEQGTQTQFPTTSLELAFEWCTLDGPTLARFNSVLYW